METQNGYSKTSKWIELNDQINSHRSPKTLAFYSSLDASRCSWRFVAYYDITELTRHCGAQLVTSSDLLVDSSASSTDAVNKQQKMDDTKNNNNNNEQKSHLIIKIPLYVSYLYAAAATASSWTSLDYKSSVEASIIYKTAKSLYAQHEKELNIDELLSFNNGGGGEPPTSVVYDAPGVVEKNDYLVSLSVSKISLTETGKLVIEFSTVPAFHGYFFRDYIHVIIYYFLRHCINILGQFVKFHPSMPNRESKFLPPVGLSNVEFGLELVWSQYTYDYPEQTWKATSNTVLNVYIQFY